MKEELKKILKKSIAPVVAFLISIGVLIISDLPTNEKIFCFGLVAVFLVILVIFYILYFYHETIKQKYKEIIKLEWRIKKDIKRLKRGKKTTYLNVGDFGYIFSNKDKFKDIKDIDILFKDIDDYNKKIRKENFSLKSMDRYKFS